MSFCDEDEGEIYRVRCVEGNWASTLCPHGCARALEGAICRSMPVEETRELHVGLLLERIEPKDDFSAWKEEPELAWAVAAHVEYHRDGEVLDAFQMNRRDDAALPGDFVLNVPIEPLDGDEFVVSTVMLDEFGEGLLAVVQPLDSTATDPDSDSIPVGLYQHRASLDELRATSSGEKRLTVPFGETARAVQVLNVLDHFRGGRNRFDEPTFRGLRLAVLHHSEHRWQGGSSAVSARRTWGGTMYDVSVFLDGGPAQPVWSRSLLIKLLGRGTNAFSRWFPSADLPHDIFLPTHPGLAFAVARNWTAASVFHERGLFIDPEGEGYRWWNFVRRDSGEGPISWPLPDPNQSLNQLVTPAEVVRLIHLLGEASWGSSLGQGNIDHAFRDLLTRGEFFRGHRSRFWTNLDEDGLPSVWEETDRVVPTFADFLDLLLCDGYLTPDELDAVLEPDVHFPYDSSQPLCP